LKMDLTEGSETSAKLNLKPGKYPKENIQIFHFSKGRIFVEYLSYYQLLRTDRVPWKLCRICGPSCLRFWTACSCTALVRSRQRISRYTITGNLQRPRWAACMKAGRWPYTLNTAYPQSLLLPASVP
jgi:hypothetical protein